jgi:hypothetical protein
MSGKVLNFNVRLSVISFIFFDIGLLLVLGLILCGVPIFLRKFLVLFNHTGVGLREQIFRWSSDIYECGITSSSVGLDFNISSDLGLGMIRFLCYVYLFLLLDLEACIMIVGFYGSCLPFYLLIFISCVLLSLCCELSKVPLY